MEAKKFVYRRFEFIVVVQNNYAFIYSHSAAGQCQASCGPYGFVPQSTFII